MDMMALRRAAMIGGIAPFVEDTATGNPCVFTTDLAKPLSRLSLSLLPRQSGTGDPSPSNIRPLIPWGKVGTWTGGKNLFDKSAKDTSKGYANRRTLIYTGEMLDSDNYYVSEFIPCTSGTYTLSGVYGSNPAICFYDEDKQFLYGKKYNVYTEVVMVVQATAPEGTCYCRISVPIDAENDVQLELGNTATAYVPYTTITPHPVNLTGITPPVYGGTIDLVTGELWGTWAFANLNSESAWGSYGTGDGFLVYVTKSDMQVGNRLPGYCDMFPSAYSATGANIRFGADDNVIRLYNINTLGIADLSEWKEFIGTDGINVCYLLATPVLLATLTPQQISAIVGTNTVWSDANNVDLTYLKKG